MSQEISPVISQEEKTNRIWRILSIAALAVIVALAASIGTWFHPYRNLKASIQYDGGKIIIQNGDDYAWIDPYVVLNTDYTFNTSTINPGNSFSINLTSFMKDKTSFDPVTNKPQDLYVYSKISKYDWSCWFYKF
jgi:hypothetical protein